MARKPNYDFEKRRKELERKAKKDARRDKRLRRDQEAEGEAPPPDTGTGAPGEERTTPSTSSAVAPAD